MEIFDYHISGDQAAANEHGYGKVCHIGRPRPELYGGAGQRISRKGNDHHIKERPHQHPHQGNAYRMEKVFFGDQILIRCEGKFQRHKAHPSRHRRIAGA